jgi:hypothetical protein
MYSGDENEKERCNLDDPRVDGNVTLKRNLNK